MISNYRQISPELEQDIIGKIYRIKSRRLLVKQGFYGVLSLFSLVLLILSVDYVINYISTSGIFAYVTLIFTNIEVLSYWKDLSMSVIESLPFFGLMFGFGVLGIFLWSLIKTMKIQVMRSSIV